MAVEFIKPGGLTGYKVVTRNEDSFEWTHVAMPRKEYYELREEVRLAYADADRAEQAAADKIAAAEERAEAAIDQAYADINQQLEELRQALAAAQRDAKYFEELNTTLLWMAKKRANAERDLRPKTEHTGYVVLRSVEKDHPYGTGKNKNVVRLWETVLQTPFSVQFSKTQAQKESLAVLFAKPEDGGWLLEKIGINGRYPKGYEAMLEDDNADEWKVRNVLVDIRWQKNDKAGYWEMVLQADFRPAKNALRLKVGGYTPKNLKMRIPIQPNTRIRTVENRPDTFCAAIRSRIFQFRKKKK